MLRATARCTTPLARGWTLDTQAVNRVLTRLKWNQLRQTHLNRRNAAEIIRPIGHGVQGRLVIGERALSVQFVSTLRDAAGS